MDYKGLLEKEASGRKFRLIGCAICRSLWHLLDLQVFKTSVETAERFADGFSSHDEMHDAWHTSLVNLADAVVLNPFYGLFHGELYRTACLIATLVSISGENGSFDRETAINISSKTEDPAPIIRDILGESFDFPQNEMIFNLAQNIYQERNENGSLNNDRLYILSDALEESGVTDSRVLNALRSDRPKYRGFWVVDQILGKE